MVIKDNEGRMAEVSVPLEDWIRQIAEHAGQEAAERVIETSRKNCPAVQKVEQIDRNAENITKVRVRFAALVGYMVGAGVISGVFVKFVL